ncbi:MAG: hypothetical protein K8W52_16660 [Deltaproteobacteria bacterium]|nr:hypothetical protein [Deltaproteobacteria bacterium]
MLILAIVGGVIGFGAAVLVWWPWQRGNVRASVFTDQIIKLAHADNLPRAAKLCAAAPDSIYVASTGHIIARVAEVPVDPARDAEAIAWLREQFHAEVNTRARRQAHGGLQAVALAGVVAVGVAVAQGAPPWTVVGAVLPVWLLGIAYRQARGLARATIDQAERMFPAIARARGSMATRERPSPS